MAILLLPASLQLRLRYGGGVSGGGVRSSSKLSIGLSTRGKVAAFGGCKLTFGDSMYAFHMGGSSSICGF